MGATPEVRRVLVTGASGYVGSRLVTSLLSQGVLVRVLVRDAAKIVGQPWYSKVEVAVGSATEYPQILMALEDVHTAFYLLHSIGAGPRFDEVEQKMALTFGQAAKDAGVSQIIYLGGIISRGGNKASQHLASRANTGTCLSKFGVPVLQLRAGIIIGSGSASFEMIRHMTHRLPIMITPKWVNNRTQPIAIQDVLYYLSMAAALSEPKSGIFDIGGPDIFTYANLIEEFALISKLRKRIIIKVPFLSVWLSSLWIGLVTPVPVALARPLVGSLVNESIADPKYAITQIIPIPPTGLLTVEKAFELAISNVEHHEVESRWSDASAIMPSWQKTQSDPAWAGEAEFHDEQIAYTDASLLSLWRSIEEIGGARGWYGADFLWWLRGILDRLMGGVGLRRGRRDPDFLRQGESLDFWRVESLQANHELTLYAEMILPGKAWLQFTVDEIERHGQMVRRLNQRASFQPKGIGGYVYWGLVLPFHRLIFPRMAKNIIKEAIGKDARARNTKGQH
jgi:uncharacterized protein YbjT (DUF2867 family)